MAPGADARPRTVAFRTLGCKVNQVESEAAAAALLGSGWRVVPASEAAVVVVNSCTVTAEADRKVRKAVRQALASPSGPIVVVTGCLATLAADALRALGDRVVVEPDRDRVAQRVEALVAQAVLAEHPRPRPATGLSRTRAMVKVEDGCDCFCAYCIVPYARGGPRSVPAAEVVRRVRELAEAGVAEVVLTGINIGRYRDDGLGLPGLLGELRSTGVRRLRLSSIEPPDVGEELLDVIASSQVFAPHLHVPLQAGSDRVLRDMGRAYDTRAYAGMLAAAREALPGLAVTTDVLAGFPGESGHDFAETAAFLEEQRFARLHVFRYSRRPGTPAAARADQVPEAVRAQRAAALRELDARLRARHRASRDGGLADVLVERVDDGVAEGTSEDYLRVSVRVPGAAVGDIVRVRLADLGADVMGGVPETG